MIWFTADWHLWHENMLHLCNRPFNKCNQLHRKLLYNHNAVINPDDTLYIVGDVYWKDNINELRRIIENYNGQKVLILGNHDRLKPFDYLDAGFFQVATCLQVEEFMLVHDPAEACCYPNMPYICGHVHTLFKKQRNALNVGVDIWDYKPVSIEQARNCFSE
jgi:calcineurin-like phosphoesterase family protein